jgi:hypothetical protein
MTVKRLKELLKDLPDDLEIYIRNSCNICGNISDLDQVEKSYYGFFGTSMPCIILNTQHIDKKLEETGLGIPFFYDYVEYEEDCKTVIRKEMNEEEIEDEEDEENE